MSNKEIQDLAAAIKAAKNTTQTKEQTIIDAINKSMLKNAQATQRLNRAIAEHLPSAHIAGNIKAIASKVHPLATELELFITDFLPNANKQGISKSESKNIIDTALNMPLKVHFDDNEIHGHKGAIAVGVISHIEGLDDRIIGRALLWDTEYPSVAAYVQQQKELYASWEVYYDPDLSLKDSTGVLWLKGCVFAGTCLVDSPAYGERAKVKVRS